MKHFLFTVVESKANLNGNTTRQLILHVVKRGIPVKLGKYNYTFESPAQACYNAIEKFKGLPKKAMDPCYHSSGSRDHELLAKLCTIHDLTHDRVYR